MVARILSSLERAGLADDTIIVLWGDNGFHLGEKLHWRKFVLWEEATRVPMIIVPPASFGPFRPRGTSPVSLIDLFPTLFDLIGLAQPKGLDGESLLPLMRGTREDRSRPVLSTWHEGNHSLRVGDWRYTQYSDGGEELYDHDADPYEWNNLAADERFATVTANCRSTLLSTITPRSS